MESFGRYIFVQYDQSVLNDHYCQNRLTGGLAAVSQVAVIMHLSVVINLLAPELFF